MHSTAIPDTVLQRASALLNLRETLAEAMTGSQHAYRAQFPHDILLHVLSIRAWNVIILGSGLWPWTFHRESWTANCSKQCHPSFFRLICRERLKHTIALVTLRQSQLVERPMHVMKSGTSYNLSSRDVNAERWRVHEHICWKNRSLPCWSDCDPVSG